MFHQSLIPVTKIVYSRFLYWVLTFLRYMYGTSSYCNTVYFEINKKKPNDTIRQQPLQFN